ncbi:ribonuclease P protein component [Coprothermobacteraceae bacterium]|nr:ribonuclease P protein component [Coprothermobacteraceae bacterium]
MAVHRSLRLRGKLIFRKVYGEGQITSSPYVVLYYLPAEETKVAAVVSRKFGTAVRRNRIRRLLLEIWTKARVVLPAGYYILLPRTLLRNVDEALWRQEVQRFLYEWGSRHHRSMDSAVV